MMTRFGLGGRNVADQFEPGARAHLFDRSRVANDIASQLRHGSRRWFNSVLNRPSIVSAGALSYRWRSQAAATGARRRPTWLRRAAPIDSPVMQRTIWMSLWCGGGRDVLQSNLGQTSVARPAQVEAAHRQRESMASMSALGARSDEGDRILALVRLGRQLVPRLRAQRHETARRAGRRMQYNVGNAGSRDARTSPRCPVSRGCRGSVTSWSSRRLEGRSPLGCPFDPDRRDGEATTDTHQHTSRRTGPIRSTRSAAGPRAQAEPSSPLGRLASAMIRLPSTAKPPCPPTARHETASGSQVRWLT